MNSFSCRHSAGSYNQYLIALMSYLRFPLSTSVVVDNIELANGSKAKRMALFTDSCPSGPSARIQELACSTVTSKASRKLLSL